MEEFQIKYFIFRYFIHYAAIISQNADLLKQKGTFFYTELKGTKSLSFPFTQQEPFFFFASSEQAGALKMFQERQEKCSRHAKVPRYRMLAVLAIDHTTRC